DRSRRPGVRVGGGFDDPAAGNPDIAHFAVDPIRGIMNGRSRDFQVLDAHINVSGIYVSNAEAGRWSEGTRLLRAASNSSHQHLPHLAWPNQTAAKERHLPVERCFVDWEPEASQFTAIKSKKKRPVATGESKGGKQLWGLGTEQSDRSSAHARPGSDPALAEH